MSNNLRRHYIEVALAKDWRIASPTPECKML